jgi:hypothetical protein
VIGKGAVVLAKSASIKRSKVERSILACLPANNASVWREMVLMKQLPEIVEKLKHYSLLRQASIPVNPILH